jgi:GalNAc-alpha-(1->4)-GalNAc-alpha-(1->3)-diNAcBac-PP-undecaprenol alpha-1,4-N-acetyl-D-galactosaminyltransferase
MRIMIVCNRLCYGGAEHVGVMLANGLAKKGHEVTLVANLFDEVTYHVDESVRKRNLCKSANTMYQKWIRSVPLIRSYLKNDRPDVIIGIMWSCSLRAKLAAIGLNIPVIATEHDSFQRPDSAPMSKFESFTKFYLNRIYPLVTVITNADKMYIGSRLKHVEVMHNPIELKPCPTVPPKDKIILAAGRLESWHYKGFDVLLKAWGKIQKEYPDWTLEIAGHGSDNDRDFMMSMAKKVGAENRIRLLGYVKDMQRLYSRAAIFVLSSRYEGFGLVLAEAMSQGCACVTTDYNGRQKEIVGNNDAAIICEPDNVDELAKGLSRLLSSDKIRIDLQKAGIDRSRMFTIDNIVSRWDKLLRTF